MSRTHKMQPSESPGKTDVQPFDFFTLRKMNYLERAFEYCDEIDSNFVFKTALAFLSKKTHAQILSFVKPAASRQCANYKLIQSGCRTGLLNPCEALLHIYDDRKLKKYLLKAVLCHLSKIIKHIEKKHLSCPERLVTLKRIFRLNEAETEVVTFLYLLATESIIERSFDSLCENMGFNIYRHSPTVCLIPVSVSAAASGLRKSSRISKGRVKPQCPINILPGSAVKRSRFPIIRWRRGTSTRCAPFLPTDGRSAGSTLCCSASPALAKLNSRARWAGSWDLTCTKLKILLM